MQGDEIRVHVHEEGPEPAELRDGERSFGALQVEVNGGEGVRRGRCVGPRESTGEEHEKQRAGERQGPAQAPISETVPHDWATPTRDGEVLSYSPDSLPVPRPLPGEKEAPQTCIGLRRLVLLAEEGEGMS